MKQYKVGDIITSPVTGVKFKVIYLNDIDSGFVIAETKGVRPRKETRKFTVIIRNRVLESWEMVKKKRVKPTEEDKEEEYYWLAQEKEESESEDYYI